MVMTVVNTYKCAFASFIEFAEHQKDDAKRKELKEQSQSVWNGMTRVAHPAYFLTRGM